MTVLRYDKEKAIKQPRYRKKIYKGLKIGVQCGGSQHDIYLTKSGRIVLAHHRDEDIQAEFALKGVSDNLSQVCRCARFLLDWQTGNYVDIPYNLDGIRSKSSNDHLGDRLWRRYKNSCLKTRPKLPTFPSKEDEVKSYLTVLFDQHGLSTLQSTKNPSEFYVNLPYIRFPKCTNAGYQKKISTIFNTKNNKLSIQSSVSGLGTFRYFDVNNIQMVPELIGSSIFRKMASQIVDFHNEDNDNTSYNEFQKLVGRYNSSTTLGIIDININKRKQTIRCQIDVSNSAGAKPYIVKKLIKLIQLSEITAKRST